MKRPQFAIWCKLAVLASLALAGCASQVPTIKTQIVKVPIPQQVPCPKLTVPPRPNLPLAAVLPQAAQCQQAAATHKYDSACGVVTKAYVASIVVLQGYSSQLEKLLGVNR